MSPATQMVYKCFIEIVIVAVFPSFPVMHLNAAPLSHHSLLDPRYFIVCNIILENVENCLYVSTATQMCYD